MTDFGPFFKPVEIEIPTSKSGIELLGDHIEVHTSKNPIDLDGHKIAIIGICDDRNSDGNEGCANGPLEIRKHLYHLFGLHLEGQSSSNDIEAYVNLLPNDHRISLTLVSNIHRTTIQRYLHLPSQSHSPS